jgi:hypothetical protein
LQDAPGARGVAEQLFEVMRKWDAPGPEMLGVPTLSGAVSVA